MCSKAGHRRFGIGAGSDAHQKSPHAGHVIGDRGSLSVVNSLGWLVRNGTRSSQRRDTLGGSLLSLGGHDAVGCSWVFLGSRDAVGRCRVFLSQLAQVIVGAFSFKGRGALVRTANLVPEGEILPVVVVEVQVVVGVVGRAVDDVAQQPRHAVIAVVDGDGPDVDEDVEAQVGDFVQGEQEGVHVVGQALHEAIHGVEGVAGEGCGDLPQVVGLVEALRGQGAVSQAGPFQSIPLSDSRPQGMLFGPSAPKLRGGRES